MITAGVPVGGLITIGQILATNTLTFSAGQNGLAVALALLSSHTAGAPVVDRKGRYIGFINEFDAMRALDVGKDLSELTAEEMMRRDCLTIHASTKITEAAKLMEVHRVSNLPVEQDGVIAYSVSRHDLLRARIGLGLGMGTDP
jgi:CBS domain-containing protein